MSRPQSSEFHSRLNKRKSFGVPPKQRNRKGGRKKPSTGKERREVKDEGNSVEEKTETGRMG